MNLNYTDLILVLKFYSQECLVEDIFHFGQDKCSTVKHAQELEDSMHSLTQLEITLYWNQLSVLQWLRKQYIVQSI